MAYHKVGAAGTDELEMQPILIRPQPVGPVAVVPVPWYQTKVARTAMKNLFLIAVWCVIPACGLLIGDTG